MAAKRELSARVQQISDDFEEEKKATFEITQDMTRQYKGMQEELLSRINTLEETVQSLNDQLADSDIRQERLLKDKNGNVLKRLTRDRRHFPGYFHIAGCLIEKKSREKKQLYHKKHTTHKSREKNNDVLICNWISNKK